MFKFLRLKKLSGEFETIHKRLAHSFTAVKKDIDHLYGRSNSSEEWIKYLHSKIQIQELQIKKLLSKIESIPNAPEDIKSIVSGHSHFETIFNRLDDLNAKVNSLISHHGPIIKSIDNHNYQLENHKKIMDRLEQQDHGSKVNLKEKIMRNINRNSKDYIKKLILSFIRKYDKISALQLREIIVEEQGLCSKSSFYRILAEIESLDDIDVLPEGKEKHYKYKHLAEGLDLQQKY